MWQVLIKVINIPAKVARITAIREPEMDEPRYVYHCTAIIDTAAQRTAVLQQIKDNYLEYLERQDQADGVIAGLIDTAENALNQWEETL